MVNLLTLVLDEQRQTMKFDNGKDFSKHAELSKKLTLSCYFTNPYHSWERGLNEHTNGLLRQFFPKQTNFRIVKPEALATAVALIDHQPQKSLNYRTPFEVFYTDKSNPDAL